MESCMSHPIAASTFQLPPGSWTTVLDGLCAQFPQISREQWLDRFERGRVQDVDGQALAAESPYRVGLRIRYFREVADEAPIPFRETLLHVDAHLVVVDKPHFLPVTPAGGFVQETVLTRLIRTLDNPDLVPLHRIDRHTAGLVMFSANPGSRSAYQALFRERRIDKHYQAWAAALPQVEFPAIRRTRIVPGEPFFRMCEVEGAANSETRIGVLERARDHWRYALQPITGRKHQLRVQMGGLGAPILHDTFYPELKGQASDDYAHPLQLLAHALSFVDPLSGKVRQFRSERELLPLE